MAHIVGVHGIGQQLLGPRVLESTWYPAMSDGMSLATGAPLASTDVVCAFYGDLFRGNGKAFGERHYLPQDIVDPNERELLGLLAAAGEPDPTAPTEKVWSPGVVQSALRVLAKSKFFAGVAEHLVIADLKQVTAYLHDERVRTTICARVLDAITDDTRVLVGHSLGSVIAYEVLANNPGLRVGSLVTLGSPLGIPNLVFDRLHPPPHNGAGRWPGTVMAWTNVADKHDPVAMVKRLSTLFGQGVADILVDNAARAHDATPYLTAEATGRAIAAGLAR
jgi:pimeloyl-ACP methyl ester carboxylesterase